MPLTRKLAAKSIIKQNTNQDTIGTGVTNLVRDAFTGTGSQTVFTLSAAPLSAANTQVFISGVYQNKNTYTISGTTLTFSTPPPNATTVEVISGTNYSIGVPGDGTVTNAKLAVAPANTIKANNTASPASPTDITISQLAAMFVSPTIQRFTTVGTFTYNTPANVKYIKIKMVGGGGGGGGAGGSSGAGVAGGASLWQTTGAVDILRANGGGAGAVGNTGVANYYANGGSGGTVVISAGATAIVAATGSDGNPSNTAAAGFLYVMGGSGGNSVFGGAGTMNASTGAGNAAKANSGSGGAGAGTNNNNINVGSGGGSGGYIEAIIVNPSSSYSYTVAAGGNGGTGSSYSGGAGGSGIIIVEEYYQ